MVSVDCENSNTSPHSAPGPFCSGALSTEAQVSKQTDPRWGPSLAACAPDLNSLLLLLRTGTCLLGLLSRLKDAVNKGD